MVWGQRKKKYEPAHDVRWLVVGLGNPGPDYANTPHNIGFDVVDALAEKARISWVAKHDGLQAIMPIGETDTDAALLKPLTYMNLSGRSVKPAMSAFRLGAPRLLVVHDEIDLPFGRLQLKVGGGLAGHNGLKSITSSINTKEFVRLRVGVGRPAPDDRRPIRDWILAPWTHSPSEIDRLIESAANAINLVLTSGVRSGLNRINQRD